jgi:hypothetical protein
MPSLTDSQNKIFVYWPKGQWLGLRMTGRDAHPLSGLGGQGWWTTRAPTAGIGGTGGRDLPRRARDSGARHEQLIRASAGLHFSI